MKQARFLRPAELEMLDAARYYEEQSTGLGDRFLDEIAHSVRDIDENPVSWPILRGDVRQKLLRFFPYGLLYREDADEVVIQAVRNLHRNPDYWTGR